MMINTTNIEEVDKWTMSSNKLLQRAQTDDSAESNNAISKFFSLLKKAPDISKVVLVCSGNKAPGIALWERSQREVAFLKDQISQKNTQISYLTAQLNAQSRGRSRGSSEGEFPWAKYPEVEKHAATMFLEGYTETEIDDFISVSTGVNRDRKKSRLSNARFSNGSPPDSLKIVVLDGESNAPTTWAEIWKIATQLHAKFWLQRILTIGGGYKKVTKGSTLPPNAMVFGLDPNKVFTKASIRNLRDRYYASKTGAEPFLTAKAEIEYFIRLGGEKGIVPVGWADGRRKTELIKAGIIFVNNGRDIHSDFAHKYPKCLAAQNALQLQSTLVTASKSSKRRKV